MTEFVNTPDWWSARARNVGEAAAAVCWSRRSQDVRFRTVRRELKIAAGDTVLDWGCGTGAFVEYLPTSTSYVGLDWSEGMRERARAEHGVEVVAELDDDDVFDHVVCIGPFNLRENWSKDQTWETLEELWTMHTRSTLVVSLYAGELLPDMIRYDLGDVVEITERLGTRRAHASIRMHLENDIVLGCFK